MIIMERLERLLASTQGLFVMAFLLAMPSTSAAFKNGWNGAPVHEDITREALREVSYYSASVGSVRFSDAAIEQIVEANREVDGPLGQLSPEYHFDNQSLIDASGRIATYKNVIVDRLQRTTALTPFEAGNTRVLIGQVLHTLQDFYAHSSWANTYSQVNTLLGNGSILVTRATTVAPNCSSDSSAIVTSRVITGYFNLNTPTGECAHGGPLVLGINKDSSDRPFHENARSLAKQHTLHFLQSEILPSATNAQSVCAVLRTQSCLQTPPPQPEPGIVTYAFTGRVVGIAFPAVLVANGLNVAVGTRFSGRLVYDSTATRTRYVPNTGVGMLAAAEFADGLRSLEVSIEGQNLNFNQDNSYKRALKWIVPPNTSTPPSIYEFVFVTSGTANASGSSSAAVSITLASNSPLFQLGDPLPSELPPLALFDTRQGGQLSLQISYPNASDAQYVVLGGTIESLVRQ